MEPNEIQRKLKKKKLDKNNRKIEENEEINAEVASERNRIRHRKKDSTPNQLINDSDEVEPAKANYRKKTKKSKKIKKKLIKNNNVDDINSNSISNQNKDYNDDPKEPPPLDLPLNVVDKIEQQVKQNEQASRKTAMRSKSSKSKPQFTEKIVSNPTKKTKKKKRPRRPLKKKIEISDGNPTNNNQNINNSPKRSVHRVILRNKEPLIKSESFDEEESLSSSKKTTHKTKIQNHAGIRPSSSASSTKSLNQKHKELFLKGKNSSDASNNSNTIRKSSSSVSGKKIQIPKDEYDEKIDSTVDEEEEEANNKLNLKFKNDDKLNFIKAQRYDSNDQESSQDNEGEEEERSASYDKNSNYENEEEEEEEEDIEKEKNNKAGSGNSGYNKPKIDQISDSYSISGDDMRKDLLSPIQGNDHRSLSDGTFKNNNHDTLSISGIIGSLGSQDSEDYNYGRSSSTSSKKQGKKRKNRNADFIILGNKNKIQNEDNNIRKRNERNRRNSDPTLDFIDFNDTTSSSKKKNNFDNFNNQNNKRAKILNVNMNIDFNRNQIRNQSVRIKKPTPQINYNGNHANLIRNNGSNLSNNEIAPLTFSKFIPKPVTFHLQNYSNANFPINDDEFHDFEPSSKKKIDLSPPINFQIQIIPNPPIIAIDAELEAYNRSKLLKEIKKQQ